LHKATLAETRPFYRPLSERRFLGMVPGDWDRPRMLGWKWAFQVYSRPVGDLLTFSRSPSRQHTGARPWCAGISLSSPDPLRACSLKRVKPGHLSPADPPAHHHSRESGDFVQRVASRAVVPVLNGTSDDSRPARHGKRVHKTRIRPSEQAHSVASSGSSKFQVQVCEVPALRPGSTAC